MPGTAERYRLPTVLVVGMPLLLWIYTYIENAVALYTELPVYREYRLIENMTVVILLVAVISLVFSFKQAALIREKIWLALLSAGAVYFLGEEISWGYHIIPHSTAPRVPGLNDQGEPNLHNLGGIWELVFDKLPRQCLSVGVIIGALLGIRAERWPGWPRSLRLRRLLPAGNTLYVAILASIVSVPEKILEHLMAAPPEWLILGNNAGELKECLLALFIAFYAYGLRRNLSAVSPS